MYCKQWCRTCKKDTDHKTNHWLTHFWYECMTCGKRKREVDPCLES